MDKRGVRKRQSAHSQPAPRAHGLDMDKYGFDYGNLTGRELSAGQHMTRCKPVSAPLSGSYGDPSPMPSPSIRWEGPWEINLKIPR